MSFSIFFNARGDNGADLLNQIGQARLLSSFDGSSATLHDYVFFDTTETSPTTRGLRFGIRIGSQSSLFESTSTFTSRDSVWHQAGFTFESGTTDGTLTFYLDGQVLGAPITTTGLNSIPEMDLNWFLVEDATDNADGFGSEYFDAGDYDEAALWTRALRAEEMSALHADGIGATAIPEPSALSMWLLFCVLGAAVCGYRRRKR